MYSLITYSIESNDNDVNGERENVNRRQTRGKSSGGQHIGRSVGERDILHKLINSNCCASVGPLFAMCWSLRDDDHDQQQGTGCYNCLLLNENF